MLPSFAELHKEGRRARRERLDKLHPRDRYQGQYSFLGQYVDGGFTSPRAGWQDLYHKNKTHEKLLNNGRQAVEEMGGDPSRIQELFDKYGQPRIGECLFMNDREYQLAVAKALLDRARKDPSYQQEQKNDSPM